MSLTIKSAEEVFQQRVRGRLPFERVSENLTLRQKHLIKGITGGPIDVRPSDERVCEQSSVNKHEKEKHYLGYDCFA